MEARSLVIGKERIRIDAMENKIRRDIAFLNNKINHIQRQRIPNAEVADMYKTMLESRYSVLNWLLSNQARNKTDSLKAAVH